MHRKVLSNLNDYFGLHNTSN